MGMPWDVSHPQYLIWALKMEDLAPIYGHFDMTKQRICGCPAFGPQINVQIGGSSASTGAIPRGMSPGNFGTLKWSNLLRDEELGIRHGSKSENSIHHEICTSKNTAKRNGSPEDGSVSSIILSGRIPIPFRDGLARKGNKVHHQQWISTICKETGGWGKTPSSASACPRYRNYA